MVFNELISSIDKLYIIVIIGFVLILTLCLFSTRLSGSVKKYRAKMNMIGYSIIYTDQKDNNKKVNIDYSTILYSVKYDIKGKPDYVFKNKITGALVPVEIKSGSIGDSKMPHKGDMLQLVTYFLIVNEVYGIKPKYGKLIYKDYMFKIRNTSKLRSEVKRTIARMRGMLKNGEEEVNPSFATCRYCVCNGTVCEYCKSK